MLLASSISKRGNLIFLDPVKQGAFIHVLVMNWSCCAGSCVRDQTAAFRGWVSTWSGCRNAWVPSGLQGYKAGWEQPQLLLLKSQLWHWLCGACVVLLCSSSEHGITLSFLWVYGSFGIMVPDMGWVAYKVGSLYPGEWRVCYLEPFPAWSLQLSACRWQGGHLKLVTKGVWGSFLGKWILQVWSTSWYTAHTCVIF